MFRKVAIALVAATVFAAPVLAQDVAPATGKSSQTTTAPAPTVKADKAITKHRTVARHHHGVKMVKHTNHVKYARHMKQAKVHPAVVKAPAKPVATKPVATKPVATTNGAATAPASTRVTTKPAAKSGTN
ncbi:MAG TPA: hypothetical protein VNO18_15730 [Xanthobacteraceae bacterium]|nr:hypothetical protein [Xanthobacteraceae bacterium]